MAATGSTPISLYYTTTAAAAPTAGNLVAGELAINTNDGKLFYKDSSGVVQTIASKAGNINVSSFSGGTTGLTPNTATTGVVTLAGTLAVANGGTGGTTSTGSGAVVLATSPTVTTPTIDKINTSVANTSLGAGNASIMKNRIINGAMVIDQRNAGASVTGTQGVYTLDRWLSSSSQTSKFTVQQNAGSVTPPVGFTNYLGITSSSAYSITASDRFYIRQTIEGFNIADLNWGTADAKTVTLSFWVRSSLTGTFGGAIYNNSGTRSYPFTYTISSANTWEQKSLTIAGDTTGTWEKTNSGGMSIGFGLGVGTDRTGTAGAWAGAFYESATGATSVVGTNGATFYITGVQLEVGSSATGFEYVNYQTSLANCQRYYWKVSGDGASIGGFGSGQCASATTANIIFSYPVTMRTAPTIAQGGTYTINFGAGNSTVSSITAYTSSGYGRFDATISGATTGYGAAGWLTNGTSNFISGSAEL
jgi:hypothetical protein